MNELIQYAVPILALGNLAVVVIIKFNDLSHLHKAVESLDAKVEVQGNKVAKLDKGLAILRTQFNERSKVTKVK